MAEEQWQDDGSDQSDSPSPFLARLRPAEAVMPAPDDIAALEVQRVKEAWERIIDLTKDIPEPLRFDIRTTVVAYGVSSGLRVIEKWKASMAERRDIHGEPMRNTDRRP